METEEKLIVRVLRVDLFDPESEGDVSVQTQYELVSEDLYDRAMGIGWRQIRGKLHVAVVPIPDAVEPLLKTAMLEGYDLTSNRDLVDDLFAEK